MSELRERTIQQPEDIDTSISSVLSPESTPQSEGAIIIPFPRAEQTEAETLTSVRAEIAQIGIPPTQATRVETEGVALQEQAEAEKNADYRKFQILVMIHGAAVSYAIGQANRTASSTIDDYTAFSENPIGYMLQQTAQTDSPTPEWQRKRVFKQEKKRAISALLELYDADKLPAEQRADDHARFTEKWGEQSEDYTGMYTKIEHAVAESELSDDVDDRAESANRFSGDATTIFKESVIKFRRKENMEYDWERKVEMLTNLGYSRGDALKAVAKIVAATGTTVALSSIAESGGAVAAGHGAVNPWLHEAPIPVQIATCLGAWGGFYWMTREYAKASAKLAEKTGFSFHVFATTISNFGKAMNVPSEKIQKSTVKAMWGLALALDAAYATSFAWGEKGSSMWTNANAFGIGFTGAQVGLTIGAHQVAEVIDKQRRIQKVKNGLPLTAEESADLEILKDGRDAYERIETGVPFSRSHPRQASDPYLSLKGF